MLSRLPCLGTASCMKSNFKLRNPLNASWEKRGRVDCSRIILPGDRVRDLTCLTGMTEYFNLLVLDRFYNGKFYQSLQIIVSSILQLKVLDTFWVVGFVCTVRHPISDFTFLISDLLFSYQKKKPVLNFCSINLLHSCWRIIHFVWFTARKMSIQFSPVVLSNFDDGIHPTQ